jgi:hypothetical protein
MISDDLEPRLRRAFEEASSAWQPNGGSATDFVRAVSRRRARRRRSVVTIGCGVAALLAVVAGAGIYSTSRTDNREVSSGSLKGATRTTVSGAAVGAGLGKSALAPQPGANPALKCAKVRVESGEPHCAGVFLPTSSISSGSAQSVASAAAPPTSMAATVTVGVGQQVTVVLPATTSGSWRAPTAVDVSGLSPTLHQELPPIQYSADPGVVRVVGGVRRAANQSITAVFEAEKPGDVVLVSTLAPDCGRTPNRQSENISPTCPGASRQWLTVLVVVAH